MWRARFINIFKDQKITYANSLFTLCASFSVCPDSNMLILSFPCEPALPSSLVECICLFDCYTWSMCSCARIQNWLEPALRLTYISSYFIAYYRLMCVIWWSPKAMRAEKQYVLRVFVMELCFVSHIEHSIGFGVSESVLCLCGWVCVRRQLKWKCKYVIIARNEMEDGEWNALNCMSFTIYYPGARLSEMPCPWMHPKFVRARIAWFMVALSFSRDKQ